MTCYCCNSTLWKHGVIGITASNTLAVILHLGLKKKKKIITEKKKDALKLPFQV